MNDVSHRSEKPEWPGASTPSSDDPPVVCRPLVELRDQPPARSARSDLLSQWASRLEAQLSTESYGAPRVFDLFTLLAITLAFALLFSFLRLIEPLLLDRLPQATLSIGAFVTLTAIAQLALWGGKKPRVASLVAGPPIWILISLGFALQNPRTLANPFQLSGMLCLSIFGIPAGYLGGALVAGVFLLADIFRRHFMRQPPDEASNDDAIWNQDD